MRLLTSFPWRHLLSPLSTRPFWFGQIITVVFTCGWFQIRELNLFLVLLFFFFFFLRWSYAAQARTMFCVVDDHFELSDSLASTWVPLLHACAAKSGLYDAKNQTQALCILGQHSESYIIYFPTHFCWHNNIRCGSSQTWNKSSSKKKTHW